VPLRLIRPGLYADEGDLIRGFLYSVRPLALLVLLAACANLASCLRHARGSQRELALRIALGASRWRLVRHYLLKRWYCRRSAVVAGLLIAGLLHRCANRWGLPGYGRHRL